MDCPNPTSCYWYTLFYFVWTLGASKCTAVVGTITAIDTFLGFLLGLSSSGYKGDGTMIVDTSDDAVDVYRMELNHPIENLGEKDQVTFKVENVG